MFIHGRGMVMKKILLREVKEAERDYSSALMRWGERNQVTLRAMVKWYDLKKKYAQQKGLL